LEQAPLVALLPCKPDQASRELAFGSGKLTVHMLGCESGDATFTVAAAAVPDPAQLAATLALWQRSTLTQLQAPQASLTPFKLDGSSPVAAASRALAKGSAADGSPLTVHAAWFARGGQVFQAAIYIRGDGKSLPADALDSFFAGLHFQ
jgi:hypothetical protein